MEFGEEKHEHDTEEEEQSEYARHRGAQSVRTA